MSGDGSFWSCCPGKELVAALLKTLLLNTEWICVVPPPQESMDNSLSLFDYGLDNPYNDLIDDFDPYLEYGERYRNRTAFEDAFYK